MQILGVRLFGCSFSFEPDAEVQKRVEALALEERGLRINVDVNIVDQEIHGDTVSLGLIVEAKAMVKDVVCWTISVAYQGAFKVEAGGDITPHQAATVHGPAQVYAFAREFVADIGRRADIATRIYLPPWNFTEVNSPIGTQQS